MARREPPAVTYGHLEWGVGKVQTAEWRRRMAADSPLFVATTYLGLRAYPHQRVWLDLFDRYRRLLLLSPRDHGKTDMAARVLPVQRIADDRNIRILLVSETGPAAAKRVDQVARDLESPRLVEDFGQFRPSKRSFDKLDVKGGKWKTSMIYVQGRTINSRDATLEGVGMGGAITGGHFDLIILDDPISLLAARSAAERRNALDWFYGTIMELCEPATQVIIIGTRKHGADLYGSIIDEDQTFHVHLDVAILKWPTNKEFLTHMVNGREEIYRVDVSPDYEVLWTEERPIEWLLLKWKANPSNFLRENQNQLIDDKSTLYKRVYFTGGSLVDDPNMVYPGCRDSSRKLWRPDNPEPFINVDGLQILQAWDLSLIDDKKKAEAADGDYTCGITAGWDPITDKRYLLGMYHERGILPSAVRGAIKNEAARFLIGHPCGAQWIAIETNLFQRLHLFELQSTTDLPLVPHDTGSNKADPYDGTPMLVGLLSNGKWVLPYGDEYSRSVARLIEDEFVGLGTEPHDDTLMAMWIWECLLRRYKVLWAKQKEARTGTVRRNVRRRGSAGGVTNGREAIHE